jgi:hypothetical protein
MLLLDSRSVSGGRQAAVCQGLGLIPGLFVVSAGGSKKLSAPPGQGFGKGAIPLDFATGP